MRYFYEIKAYDFRTNDYCGRFWIESYSDKSACEIVDCQLGYIPVATGRRKLILISDESKTEIYERIYVIIVIALIIISCSYAGAP